MSIRQRLKAKSPFAQWLLLGAGLFILGSVIGLNLYIERNAIDAQERERLSTQARVIDENLGYQLHATNRALDSIRSELPVLTAQKNGEALVHRRLQAMGDAMPGVRTLVILDAEGTVNASNREELMGRNFRDREYFQIARQNRDPAMLLVTPPYKTVLRVFAMNLVKTIPDDRGGFGGVIAATLDPEYFNILLDSVRYAPDMWASLAHGDGKLFLMIPTRPGIEGADLAKPGSFRNRHLDTGQKATVMTGIVYATGEERMMAQRIVKPVDLSMDKPLAVAVARDLPSIFAVWREEALVRSGLFGVLVLATTLGLYFYQKRQLAYARLTAVQEAEREQMDEVLRQSEARFRQMFEGNASVLLLIEPDSGAIVDANAAAAHFYGYSVDRLRAMGIDQINTLMPAEIAAERSRALAMKRNYFIFPHRLASGEIRTVEVRSTPIGVGARILLFSIIHDVTERKRAEEALQTSEMRFRTMLLEIPSVAVQGYGPDGTTHYWNHASERLYGYSAEEALGHNLLALIIPPELHQGVREAMRQMFETGQPIPTGELSLMRKDGSRVDVISSHAYAHVPGKEAEMFCVDIDLTERKHVEEILRVSEERHRLLADNATDVIWTMNFEGRFTYVSPSVEKLRGYDSAEAMRQSLEQSLTPASFAIATQELGKAFAAAKAGLPFPEFRGELEQPCRDGTSVWTETTITGMRNAAAEIIGILGVSRDITERKKADDELKRSNAELEQFSYSISHDMRQPLRMISSYLQLLELGLAEKLDAETREYFNFAIDGAKRLDQMLVALLEYSRVGRKGEPPVWVESRAILDEALLYLQPATAEAQASVGVNGDWPRVFVSRDEMLRLLQNLIGNAIKFRVAGRTPQIGVTSETSGTEWRVSVADNGAGIVPDQIGRLFQVFQRLHSRAAYEGTGIGLALCRKIAEHHGGRIWAETAGEGKGSTFKVALPMGPREAT